MELFLGLSIIAFIAVVTIDTIQQRRQLSGQDELSRRRNSLPHGIRGHDANFK